MWRRLKVLVFKFRSEGIISGTTWLAKTLYLRLIPHKQAIWYTNLEKLDSKNFNMPNNIEIHKYHSEDQMDKEDYIILIEQGNVLMGSAGEILVRKRFNDGAVLWLLKVDNKLAGYRWTIANDHVHSTYLPQTDTDVHSIGLELFPEFRGRNLFGLFRNGVHIILKNEGFRRCYSETNLHNKASIKAHLKIGAHKIGIATKFKIFRKNIVIWHDMSEEVDCL